MQKSGKYIFDPDFFYLNMGWWGGGVVEWWGGGVAEYSQGGMPCCMKQKSHKNGLNCNEIRK